jgi:N6-L-threonylcarbamoyladenine synthase
LISISSMTNDQQAHALTPLLTAWPNQPAFPFLTQLISGGHTLLLLATSVNSFRILATTRDESIGRSFDKVSKLLELNWTELGPGDALEKFCAEEPGIECPSIPAFPRPLLGKLAYSFAALHSHAKQFIELQGGIANLTLSMKRAIARGFQIAAVQHLEEKLLLGLNYCKNEEIPVRSVVVSGGVASNTFLRERCDRILGSHFSD